MATKSGRFWVTWANTNAQASRSVEDLAEPFRGKAKAFIAALRQAGATVEVTNTLRSPKRAYLFHWSWRISQNHGTPQQADADPMAGVDIQWDHGSLAASKAGAAEMVTGFGLAVPPRSTNPPAQSTNHSRGTAIDMTISWSGTINVKKADNTVVAIPFNTNVNANAALHGVGASYGVLKLVTDAPHWSDNGR
jgi:hypothetical protein